MLKNLQNKKKVSFFSLIYSLSLDIEEIKEDHIQIHHVSDIEIIPDMADNNLVDSARLSPDKGETES